MAIEKLSEIPAEKDFFRSCAFCRTGPASNKIAQNNAEVIYLCDGHTAVCYDAKTGIVTPPASDREPIETEVL